MSRNAEGEAVRYRGRRAQIPLYLKKFFRMFLFMNDWKVIPMAALVAAVTSIVVADKMSVDMEGTLKGALALSCICIWNGFFNSIQSVCRERDVIKREHRNGMHIFSYVTAQMIYQAFICLCQVAVTLGVCALFKMKLEAEWTSKTAYLLCLGLTLFLLTYAADMTSLFVSAAVRSTTASMTVMPFMLIFELVFSNTVFRPGGILAKLTDLSLVKWGVRAVAGIANYNSLPMSSVWSQLSAWKDFKYLGMHPIQILLESMDKEKICQMAGEMNYTADYATTVQNIGTCWVALVLFAMIFAILTMIVLKRLDADKR